MRGSAQEIYTTHLKRAEEKLGADLDWQHYDALNELDLNVKDLLTPATAISIAGLALVLDGCKDLSKVQNVHKIAIGRGFDMVDGVVARTLKQSSDIGGAVDVVGDKYAMWRIGKAAWQQDALPKPYVSYVVGKNIAHAGLTIGAALQHPNQTFRPPKSGKLSMFGDNVAGGLLLYANAYEHEKPELELHDSLYKMGRTAIIGGVAAELIALPTYLRRLSKDFDVSDPSFMKERLTKLKTEKLHDYSTLQFRDFHSIASSFANYEYDSAA